MTQPAIHLVVAMTQDRVIGYQGAMPWHLPRDLGHFKAITLGHPVIMGRKTFESIIDSLGKPLPGRLNIVISRTNPAMPEGVLVYPSFDAALAALTEQGVLVVDVIGGGQIYELAIPKADRLYVTLIDAKIEGDTWFPKISAKEWQVTETETHPRDDNNAYAMTFVTFDRVEPSIEPDGD